MHNSYDVIEFDNYAILNTLQNFHFQEYFIFVFPVELKICQTQYWQNNKMNIILVTMYLTLNWNIVKKVWVVLSRNFSEQNWSY